MILIPDLPELPGHSHRGKIDIVTLAVAMVPMILFIILAGQVITEKSIDADTQTQMQSKGNIYESIAAMDHVITYRDNYRALNNYSEPPVGDQISKSEVKNRLSEASSYLQDSLLNFQINYRVNVEMPESDNFNVSSSDTGDIYLQTTANVASPKKEALVVSTTISE